MTTYNIIAFIIAFILASIITYFLHRNIEKSTEKHHSQLQQYKDYWIENELPNMEQEFSHMSSNYLLLRVQELEQELATDNMRKEANHRNAWGATYPVTLSQYGRFLIDLELQAARAELLKRD